LNQTLKASKPLKSYVFISTGMFWFHPIKQATKKPVLSVMLSVALWREWIASPSLERDRINNEKPARQCGINFIIPKASPKQVWLSSGNKKSPTFRLSFQSLCGERGIRTPGTLLYNGFQDHRIRPLCHLSFFRQRCKYKAFF
jgi:hypothetical protein